MIKRYAELGLIGMMTVPKKYDGTGAGDFAHILAIEQLAYAGSPALWPVAFNNSLPAMIVRYGTEEQKEFKVERLCQAQPGNIVISVSLEINKSIVGASPVS